MSVMSVRTPLICRFFLEMEAFLVETLPVSKWMARLYELEGKPLPDAAAKPKPSLDVGGGRQALLKAYNGALKEPVLLAVAEEYQTLWGCKTLWVVPAQQDKEGRDALAFTQDELFTVIDAVMANKDGAHALIQGYRMAGGRIECKKEEPY